jgi:hypothetical protein
LQCLYTIVRREGGRGGKGERDEREEGGREMTQVSFFVLSLLSLGLNVKKIYK